MRIFDSDGNDYLDFKEFLLAVDIATCQTEASKLAWVFKLYDVDNDGIIDVHEMAFIMETMDCIESGGGSTSSSKNKNSPAAETSSSKTKKNCENVGADIDDIMTCTTPLERAQNLFDCLDHKNENTLTKEEFIAGYLERNVLLAKQDALDQQSKFDCLILRGPFINNIGEVNTNNF